MNDVPIYSAPAPVEKPHKSLWIYIVAGVVVVAILGVILTKLFRMEEVSIPGEDLLGTPPPSLNDDPTQLVLDNGQERLYSVRATVDDISSATLHIRIPSVITNDEGTFVDYIAKKAVLGDDTVIFRLSPDSSALNGLSKQEARLADIFPGMDVEIYSNHDIERVESFPSNTIYILY